MIDGGEHCFTISYREEAASLFIDGRPSRIFGTGGRRDEKLPLVELLIRFARRQQLLVLALAHDPSAIHHHNRVGAEDRAEAMGDDERRSLVQQAVDRLLDQVLALGVHLAGGFVEDEDRRLAIDRPGDAEPLLLPAGKLGTQAAQQRVISLRLFEDELVGEGALGRGFDLGFATPGDRRRRCSRRWCRGRSPSPG